jgi:uridine phosphorylase
VQQPYPILEYDPDPAAVIEPRKIIKPIDAPEHCVICFFQEVINRLARKKLLTRISVRKSEIGKHPVYTLDYDGRRLALFHPGVGAPLAAGLLDEIIALGCRKFIACGSAGVLNRDIAVGHLVVPLTAVRDEGTSYHYLPPGREVAASPAGVDAVVRTLEKRAIPYVLGKTWTTDAIFRETPAKVALRAAEGCLAVEMEAAAFFAVAQARGVTFAQILYGGDDVSGTEWDHRGYVRRLSVRERLFWLATEACLAIE